jgi:flagellar hook assembly protein FlgD
VRVFDAHGALVREIYRGSLGEGEHTATWDGRDDSGRAMPSGVYFGRIETAETQAVHKVVLLK